MRESESPAVHNHTRSQRTSYDGSATVDIIATYLPSLRGGVVSAQQVKASALPQGILAEHSLQKFPRHCPDASALTTSDDFWAMSLVTSRPTFEGIERHYWTASSTTILAFK
jgi:hypothetical protein